VDLSRPPGAADTGGMKTRRVLVRIAVTRPTPATGRAPPDSPGATARRPATSWSGRAQSREIADPHLEALVLHGLGRVHAAKGDPTGGRGYFRLAQVMRLRVADVAHTAGSGQAWPPWMRRCLPKAMPERPDLPPTPR
jgi:hypothetical protein